MILRKSLFRSRTSITFIAVFSALILGITLGTVLVLDGFSSSEELQPSQLEAQERGKQIPSSHGDSLTDGFTRVAEAVEPAVVNINTSSIVNLKQQQRKVPEGFREFFGDDLYNRFFQGPAEQKRASLGSGVIVDSEGYILSNHHVVAPLGGERARQVADKISVTLHTGETFAAKVVGVDPESDLAVIKIDSPKPLSFVRIGSSSDLRIGEWVLAIGNPFGVGKTVTAGIVSATSRIIPGSKIFGDYIQTDAAINPGNSGGPLVNMAGEVVGVNTLIISGTGGSQGVGFAIPSTVFINSYNQLISKGKIERGWLGISMNGPPITEEMAEYFGVAGNDPNGIKDGDGILVTQLVDERGEPALTGPAYTAGLREEDIIVKLGDHEVENPIDLRSTVANTPPGEEIPVVVVRAGQVKRFTVTLAERTLEQKQRSDTEGLSFEQSKQEEKPKEIGMEFRTLNARDSDQLGLNVEGVIVTEVPPGSLADEAGLLTSHIITQVNGMPVKTDDQFYETISKMNSGQGVVLRVVSVNQRRQVSVVYVSFRKP